MTNLVFIYREKRKDASLAQGQIQEDQSQQETKEDSTSWKHQRLP